MRNDSKWSASLHPSIDGLAALIKTHATNSKEEVTKLREMCKMKMRSYREDDFLKRFATPSEKDAARMQWNIVATFANR